MSVNLRVDGTTYEDANSIVVGGKTIEIQEINGSGYTFCEYIESSGTQWIDTGWVHGANSTIVLDVNLTNSSRDSYIAVFGSMNPNYSNNAWTFFCRFNGTAKPTLARTGNEGQGSNLKYGKRITIIANGTKAAWTGDNTTNSVTSSGTANEGVITMALFTNHEGTRYNRHCVMKLYGAKFYTGDVMERDFVPAKRNSDNVYGLYDRVNGVFYASVGSGNFTGA